LLRPRPGDEVIVPAITYVSTAMAFHQAGFTVRVADVDPETLLLTAGTVAPCLSGRTRAVVAVHLYGQHCELDAIHGLCDRRGLVLIDPPYEDAADFTQLSGTLASSHRKWPTGVYLLWYLIKDREAPDSLARRLRRLDVPKILRCEFTLGPPRAEQGLVGSGLIVVNPPYPLEQDLRLVLPALGRLLAPQGGHRLDWLAPAG